MRKLLVLGAAAAGLLGLTLAWARPLPAPAQVPPILGESAWPLEAESVAVRLLLGVGDEQQRPWNGKVAVDQGAIAGVEGWRFRQGDEVQGRDAWKARSLPIRKAAAKQAAVKTIAGTRERGGPGNTGPLITPTGVVVRLEPGTRGTLTVATEHGAAQVPLADLAAGVPRRYLEGRIEARRVPPYAPIATTSAQEDFPAAIPDGKGGAWVVYVAHEPRGTEASEAYTERPKNFRHLVPTGGGDQIKLLHFDGKLVQRASDVTGPGLDVWRPAVAVDGQGKVVVVWSELKDGNWDLFARTLDPASFSWTEPRRLTTQPGTDTAPALAVAHGRVLVAWQSWIDGQAEILLAPVEDVSKPINISNHPANDWSPALAVDPSGNPIVAYDSYRNGHYDVFVAFPGGRTVAAADSTRFEARPSIAVDRRGRVWVAYEERPDNWGKDFGNIPDTNATALYQDSAVRVRCIDGGQLLDVADPVAGLSEPEQRMNAFARLTLDSTGRPVLLYRHRQEAIWGNNTVMVVGAVWVEYATTLAGTSWTPPQPLPRSDNLLDNRPAMAATPSGPVLVFYSSDGRLHRELEHRPDLTRRFYSHSGTPPGVVNNDLFVAALSPPPNTAEPAPGGPAARPAPVSPTHPNEAADVARMRSYRIETGGKTYQLLRGEFHRHTEISQDGGNDGALEDMWRYALDVVAFDWIGCGDHDNGGGKEYTWWLTQKTTDLYHHPPTFVPMFTYERSVGYPGGHRNVMFPYRGVRTLPRYIDENGVRNDVRGVDEDAAMLYDYLRELNGICAAHTSATSMGTDWRAHNPNVEPFVEIYQGIRNSYEYFGAPRVAHSPADAVGGWRPLGMVWNALAMQYRLGFQASSDHVSTHISFAIAIAERPTREALFDAFKKRHCYAATDNILLDVRCGDHLMGDEFAAPGPVTLKVAAHGTGPIARVDVIKDFSYAYSTEPKSPQVSFTWTDDGPRELPVSWYYVRVLQEDGEIAWGSPIWVRRAP